MSYSHSREQLEDDLLLVVRVGEGDAQAYRKLVQRHAEQLHHYAVRLLRNSADAEDVVQETFLRLWLHATDYTPSARVTTWLHRIAHNLAIDRLRSRNSLEASDEGFELTQIPEPKPDQLEAKLDAAALHRALDALPARQAAALVLVHFNGLSGQEASEVLGVGEGAVESLLARGRRNLRARMGKPFDATHGDSQ